jgi:hypothetical protein
VQQVAVKVVHAKPVQRRIEVGLQRDGVAARGGPQLVLAFAAALADNHDVGARDLTRAQPAAHPLLALAAATASPGDG